MEVLERVAGVNGELVLRGDGRHHEVVSNGTFLMDDRGGASERLLARVALDGGPGPADVLVGGLGVGLTLAEALAHPRTRAVTVLEVEPAVVRWNRGPLAPGNGGALADPRVRVVQADLVAWLRTAGARFDALCLDVDNGPDWTVVEGNRALYDDDGLDLLAARTAPGGVLAVWSAAPAPAFAERLAARLGPVGVHEVPGAAVARGAPDVVYAVRPGRG